MMRTALLIVTNCLSLLLAGCTNLKWTEPDVECARIQVLNDSAEHFASLNIIEQSAHGPLKSSAGPCLARRSWWWESNDDVVDIVEAYFTRLDGSKLLVPNFSSWLPGELWTIWVDENKHVSVERKTVSRW